MQRSAISARISTSMRRISARRSAPEKCARGERSASTGTRASNGLRRRARRGRSGTMGRGGDPVADRRRRGDQGGASQSGRLRIVRESEHLRDRKRPSARPSVRLRTVQGGVWGVLARFLRVTPPRTRRRSVVVAQQRTQEIQGMRAAAMGGCARVSRTASDGAR